MTEIIDTVPAARALLADLGATLPELPHIEWEKRDGGSVPIFDQGAWADHQALEQAAITFLVEAVDSNADLLWQLWHADKELTAAEDYIAGGAWCEADHAVRDPFVPTELGERSLAQSLAFWALTGGTVARWRRCDIDAALDVLSAVAAEIEANPADYEHVRTHLRNEIDARLWLFELEPTMIDRRPRSKTL